MYVIFFHPQTSTKTVKLNRRWTHNLYVNCTSKKTTYVFTWSSFFQLRNFDWKGPFHITTCAQGLIVFPTMTGWSRLPSAKTVNNSDERKREFMTTSSNGNVFRATGPLCGEFTGTDYFPIQRPVARSFDVFFDLRRDKWLSKQSRRRLFEMQWRSLWRHCYVYDYVHSRDYFSALPKM